MSKSTYKSRSLKQKVALAVSREWERMKTMSQGHAGIRNNLKDRKRKRGRKRGRRLKKLARLHMESNGERNSEFIYCWLLFYVSNGINLFSHA